MNVWFVAVLPLAFLSCNALHPNEAVSRTAAAAVQSAGFPSPVYISDVSGADLRAEMRSALWRLGIAVVDSPLMLPPEEQATVLLAGSVEEVMAAYSLMSDQYGVTSELLTWAIVAITPLHDPSGQQVASQLTQVLREAERALVVICDNSSLCVNLTATSPGGGSVELVPWRPGQLQADWRLWQLGGRQLRVLVPLLRKPRTSCNSDVVGSWRLPDNSTQICGYLGEVLLLLADKLNFRPKFVRKSGCGTVQADGSLNGRPLWLQQGRGDLGASSCTKDLVRSRAVYMGEWFWSDTTSIGTGQPEHAHSEFLVFGVFTWQLWLTTVAFIVLCGALLRGAEWISGRVLLQHPHGQRPLASTVDFIQLSVRIFLGQGDDVCSGRSTTRCLIGFVYMSSITLMAVYSGNLTAFLSFSRLEPAIETLRQLADSDLEPHVTFGQSHYYLFANVTSSARGRIWSRMESCDGCVHAHHKTTSTDEFVSRIVAGQVALFQSTRSLLNRGDLYLERRNISASQAVCPIRLARGALRRDFYTLMLPHFSKYRDVFDRAISRLRGFGVIAEMFNRVAANRCQRQQSSVEDVGPLNTHKLQGAFIVWLVGLAAAGVLLVAELLVARFGSPCRTGAVLSDREVSPWYLGPSELPGVRDKPSPSLAAGLMIRIKNGKPQRISVNSSEM